jgi:nitroimidazol reductase NimA-like FMN-containing flavoprotein (pyridoxamine 5'-phosphate oxidase superfamily)
MSIDRHGMSVLAGHDCLELLRTVEVGRIALNGDFPEILPVNFVVDHGAVVFRTASGSKLDALVQDHRVAFEADGVDLDAGEAWSVVIKGYAALLRGAHERFEALDLPLFPWQAAPKHHVVRIAPVEITGRHFAIVVPRPGTGQPVQRAADE